MDAVTIIKPCKLEKYLCINTLTFIIFLKRRRTGKIKAQGCADGQSEQKYIYKVEASSPTVSIYALMACCVINSIENRHLVPCDIPGLFLQANWVADKPAYLRFNCIMVDMLCEINSSLKSKVE